MSGDDKEKSIWGSDWQKYTINPQTGTIRGPWGETYQKDFLGSTVRDGSGREVGKIRWDGTFEKKS